MSPSRLARYRGASQYDRYLALRLYVWNARLCEEFYLPLQMAEIAIRNTIHQTIMRRFGNQWFSDSRFTSQLTQKYQDELPRVAQQERDAHRGAFTVDHLVSGMTFGFWVHLLTARYENLLWQQGMKRSFPYIGNLTRVDVHTSVDQLRTFRNRVAHHSAIFDRRPTAEYANLQTIVSWVCPETVWLIKQLSNPAKIIGNRPRI